MPDKATKLSWVPGMKSPNPLGRKLEDKSIDRAVDRFLKGVLTVKQMKVMYAALSTEGQLRMITFFYDKRSTKPIPLESKEMTDEQYQDWKETQIAMEKERQLEIIKPFIISDEEYNDLKDE